MRTEGIQEMDIIAKKVKKKFISMKNLVKEKRQNKANLLIERHKIQI